MIGWLVIGILAIILVLPCVLLSSFYADKVEVELCKRCIYEAWRNGKTGPCSRCIDCDHFERRAENGNS